MRPATWRAGCGRPRCRKHRSERRGSSCRDELVLVGVNSTGGTVLFNIVNPRIGATDEYLAANFRSIPVN
jgi:hypothetical protein